MMGTVRHILHVFAVLTASAAVSCVKTEPSSPAEDSGENIAFYVRTPDTRAMIEDAASLADRGLSIHVTDMRDTVTFRNRAVAYSGNGAWRSDRFWTSGKEYEFFAYVSSPGSATGASVSSISDNGRTVTVSQPSSYSDSPDGYSDYLLSYRVTASGSRPAPVELKLERVTTGVELYMSTPNPKDEARVILKEASFINIVRSATFSIADHAASSSVSGSSQIMNTWRVVRSTQRVTYLKNTGAEGLELEYFDPAGGDFGYDYSKYGIMRFLTVRQPLTETVTTGVTDIVLHLEYAVEENGQTVDYEVDMPLKNYRPTMWSIGHKVRYYVTIDSSIDLVGTVVKWNEVDFIEGTLLPD